MVAKLLRSSLSRGLHNQKRRALALLIVPKINQLFAMVAKLLRSSLSRGLHNQKRRALALLDLLNLLLILWP